MKKFAIAAAFAAFASTSFAGSVDDPVIEPEVIVEETTNSASIQSIIVPALLLGALLGAAI